MICLLTRPEPSHLQWTTVIGSLESKSPFSQVQRVPSLFALFPTSRAPLARLEAVLPLASRHKNMKTLSASWCFLPAVSQCDHRASRLPCSLSFLSSSSFFSCAFWALVSFLWRGKEKWWSVKHASVKEWQHMTVQQCVWDLTAGVGEQPTYSAPPVCITLMIVIMCWQDFSPYLFFLGRLSFTRGRDRRILEVKMGMQHTGEDWEEHRKGTVISHRAHCTKTATITHHSYETLVQKWEMYFLFFFAISN